MAGEANTQETITENSTVDTEAVSDETVDTTVSGGDVQATDADIKADDSGDESDKPADKQYDEKYVKKLRDEAAAARVKSKEAEKAAREAAEKSAQIEKAQKELIDQVGRAFGFVKDDATLSPEELLQQATEREQQIAQERDSANERIRNFERRDALTQAVNKVDGDLDAILDSRKVNEAIAKLDTTADDFASQVDAIVSAAVESNPKLKKAPVQVAAPRSGGDLSGGNGAPKPTADKTIDDLRREKRERAKRELS